MMSRRQRRLRSFFVLLLVIVGSWFTFKWGAHKIKAFFYPLQHESAITTYSEQFQLDPMFVAAVINVESKFKADAESSKGAKGLMQICDATALWAANELEIENFVIDDLFEPETNIQIGCWYLNRLRIEFGDEEQLILAAYNGGSGNVTKWLEDATYSHDGESLHMIPFEETSQYVDKVLYQYAVYKEIYLNE